MMAEVPRASSQRTRTVGRALAAVMLAATLVATLTPQPGNVVTASFWCIACGEFGALDFAANIVMFMPLGLAFALSTGRRWRTVVICVAITVFIEAMQVRVIPGRDASLGDLIANTLGGWIGAEIALMWRAALWPSGPAARWLVAVWAGAFALVGVLTSAGLRPSYVPTALWVQWTPARSSYTPFTGQLHRFDINGINLVAPFPPQSSGLDRALSGEPWRATTTVSTEGLEPSKSVIVRIAEERTVIVSVEQRGRDLSCYQKTRAADFRFRSPRAALPGVFVASARGDSTRLICGRSDRQLIAGMSSANGTRSDAIRLSPALGWVLMSPFDLPVERGLWWIGAAWLMVLGFPGGFWLARVRTTASGRNSIVLPGVAAFLGLTIALAVAPAYAGTAPAKPWEWLVTLGGMAVGAVIAGIVPYRVSSGSSPDRAR